MNERTTQRNQILAALLAGEKLTPLDALNRFSCFRLGGRIYDLKQEGYAITSTMVERKGKRFAEYRLEGK